MIRGRRLPLQSSRNSWAPWFFTASAGLQAVTDALLHPVIFFPSLVFLIGGTRMQMASFLVASVVAWSAAPLVLTLIRGFTQSLRAVTWIALLVRLLAIGTIGWVGLNVTELTADRLLALLVSAWIVYQAAGALTSQSAAPAQMNLLARGGRLRHLRWRHLVGALVTFGTGWIVYRLFEGNTSLATDLRGVLVLATLGTIGASWFVALMLFGRTSISPGVDGSVLWHGMTSALRNAAVRRLMLYRLLLASVAAFDPFLIVFGFTNIGVDIYLIGVAFAAWATGQVVGSWMWPWVVNRVGARMVFQLAALCRLALLVWVVAIPSFVTTTAFTDRFTESRDPWLGFGIGFVLLGLATAAGSAANAPYLMRVANPTDLPATGLVTNLGAVIGGFLPLAVAWSLDRYDDERVFWVGIGLGVVALLGSGLLMNAGTRVRSHGGAWRRASQTRTV